MTTPATTTIFLAEALLPSGWARDVRVGLAGARIATVEPGAAPQPGDIVQGVGIPGLPNLRSHSFHRGMAGLSERRGPVAAQAFAEMLEGGFTRARKPWGFQQTDCSLAPQPTSS